MPFFVVKNGINSFLYSGSPDRSRARNKQVFTFGHEYGSISFGLFFGLLLKGGRRVRWAIAKR